MRFSDWPWQELKVASSVRRIKTQHESAAGLIQNGLKERALRRKEEQRREAIKLADAMKEEALMQRAACKLQESLQSWLP